MDPDTTLNDWMIKGACTSLSDEEKDWFFPGDERDPEFTLARSVCAVCPVQKQCLQHAYSDPSTMGVWGGRLFTGKTVLSHKEDLSWYFI